MTQSPTLTLTESKVEASMSIGIVGIYVSLFLIYASTALNAAVLAAISVFFIGFPLALLVSGRVQSV